jgi:hypothetical protein
MPPTHPSQADVAAAYRTLIAHETEPKEQDFYRTRLQRLEQTTEPVCELDCRNRVAAAGVGVYCPQCSAKCADTDLATKLAKAIRAAWVDRLDWDELAQGALEFLTAAGRLIPAGGMALTAEQVEDVRTLVGHGGSDYAEAFNRLRALFPATEPDEDVGEIGWYRTMTPEFAAKNFGFPDVTGWVAGNTFVASDEGKWLWDGTEWGFVVYPSAPVEPTEEETKAELCAVRLCVLPARHSGVHADREGLRWNNPASSPVVPAPTETGPWQTWQEVPEGVKYKSRADRHPHAPVWMNQGGDRLTQRHSGEWVLSMLSDNGYTWFAPFVAAEEG